MLWPTGRCRLRRRVLDMERGLTGYFHASPECRVHTREASKRQRVQSQNEMATSRAAIRASQEAVQQSRELLTRIGDPRRGPYIGWSPVAGVDNTIVPMIPWPHIAGGSDGDTLDG